MAAEAEGSMPMVRDSPALCWENGIGDGTTSRPTVADASLAHPVAIPPFSLAQSIHLIPSAVPGQEWASDQFRSLGSKRVSAGQQ